MLEKVILYHFKPNSFKKRKLANERQLILVFGIFSWTAHKRNWQKDRGYVSTKTSCLNSNTVQ